MRRAARLAVAFAPLVLAGCTDAGHAPAPTPARSNLIRDELHNGGTTGFLFLPPMVPRPAHVGDFIPTVTPTVRIDEITSTGATVRTLATFTATTGPDRERLRTHLEDRDCDSDDDDGDTDPEGYFYARWKTNNANLSVNALYRARVLVPAAGGGLRELGFADVQVVRSEREFRTVDTQNFTPLVNGKTLRIKFRIDRPAVDADNDGVFDWVDNCPATANPTQLDSNRDGKGDACQCLGVTCRASDACHSVGTCSPATGLCSNPVAPNGTACSLSGSSAVCTNGTCGILTCATGSANCDGNVSNGCETSLNTLTNCGGCGVACTAPAHATASCATGTCAFTCNVGWADANGSRADGCELDITTDSNCGAPGNACVSDASGTSTCVSGACSTMACAPGSANCNTSIADGCEVSLNTDASNCGACGRACSVAHATAACVAGACAVGTCDSGYADCDGIASTGCETTPANDVNNCGACGHACSLAHASAVCATGACAVGACDAGWADCNGNPADGCETDLTDPSSCGACGNACSVPHATPACTASACVIGTCATGFADCDSAAAGCETDLSTVSNCGACGNTCASGPNSAPVCGASGCAIACAAGFADCDHTASTGCEIDATSDRANCGACGHACGDDEVCDSGACTQVTCAGAAADCNHLATDLCEVTTDTDVSNCGACGHVCSFANAPSECVSGACGFAVCNVGYGDCDGAQANGCEADLNNDAAHCGGCGTVCTFANAAGVCRDGACALGACREGFADCDGDPSNGCEADLSSTSTCGACGRACASGPNSTPVCGASGCSITCAAGFADCDGSASTGCEQGVASDRANCGACGVACGADEVCTEGACTAVTCSGSTADCNHLATDLCEIDTASDVRHCGACGHECAFAHAGATCSLGVCVRGACDAGWADCDGDASNGCEVNVTSSVGNCGACGNACSADHGTPACSTGACVIAACDSGYADCDHALSNGCELNVATSTANCGACGNACPTPASSTATCTAGSCGYACVSGQADCNGSATDGCEQNIASDRANCGACGHACGADEVCTAGTCTALTCPSTRGDCNHLAVDGCETNILFDVNNCAACGAACSFANASASCSFGACVMGACAAGYLNCDGSPSNGCETVNNTVTNCGACGRACSLSNAVPSCSAGACGVAACNTGYGDCNGVAADGCETSLTNNVNNCGTCGRACGAQQLCISGQCLSPQQNRISNCNDDSQLALLPGSGLLVGWGNNGYTVLGGGSATSTVGAYTTPQPAVSTLGALSSASVTGSPRFSCVVKTNGEVWCWGNDAVACELGPSPTGTAAAPCRGYSFEPRPLLTGTTAAGGTTLLATAVVVSKYAAFAIRPDGTIASWGAAYLGAGLISGSSGLTLATVSTSAGVPLTGVVRVSAMQEHGCAVLNTGNVWCWGHNNNAQVGDGTTVDAAYATRVLTAAGTPLTGIVEVSAGTDSTVALRSDGTVWAWGSLFGNYARQISGISGAVAVSAMYFKSALVLLNDGTLRAFGQNGWSVFGLPTSTTGTGWSMTPWTVPGISGAVAIGGGLHHRCALLSDGTARCWGTNNAGQLGNNTTTDSISPVNVWNFPTAGVR